jgi:glutamyl-tRNA reductase
VLSALWARGEAIRRRELDRALRSLGSVPAAVRDQMDALTRSLVSKLLGAPARRLREETDLDRRDAYTRASIDLFGLVDRAHAADNGAGAPDDGRR